MDKLTMAHEYAVKLLEHGNMTPEEVVETSWYITDAMQAEADKRINTERPDVLRPPKLKGPDLI